MASSTATEAPKSGRLPILIFPGLMSSALEVKKSNVMTKSVLSAPQQKSSWEGKQAWLNIKSAGFESLYVGSAMQANEILKEHGEDYNEALHEKYKQENNCKSQWIQHMRLAEDMRSDVEGIEVRPMEGVKAVEYLMPGGGAIARAVSWVFLPVNDALRKVGYRDGHDLDAAPYDWRLPPSDLETRDSFFSRTMKQVEKMYQRNNDTPIVFLCHSMGTRACHYFLNFCLRHPKGGRAWIDKHVHTYLPVGGPHLGAPKTFRGTMDGDKMGLESVLSDEEALILGRSWGSVPWLYPSKLPPTNAPPNAFLRREGVLHVTVLPFNCQDIFRGKAYPPKLRLTIKFGDKVLHSKYHTSDGVDGKQYDMTFSETFTFAAPPDLPQSTKQNMLRVSLEEPVIWGARKHRFWNRPTKAGGSCMSACGCAPCIVAEETIPAVAGITLGAADLMATAVGTTRKLAVSDQEDVSKILKENNPGEFCLNLIHVKDVRKKKQKSVDLTIQVRWEEPQHDFDATKVVNFSLASPSDKSPKIEIRNEKDTSAIYESVNGIQLLKSEFLPRHKEIMLNCYEPDPLGPRALSSESAPPVKRVFAIYGTDLDTEVGAVYRRRNIIQEKGRLQQLHKLDGEARLAVADGYSMENGLIVETPKTPQRLAGDDATFGKKDKVVRRCGDGTVPYWSLQHCRTWQDKCEVTVHELKFAEHREILADERFHKILIDYVAPNATKGSSA